MGTVLSILGLAAMSYACYRLLKWMLRAGQTSSRSAQPLTPTDLKVLEETAGRLMADLRLLTDECVTQIETACAKADRRLVPTEKAEARPEGIRMPAGEIELMEGLRAISTHRS